MESDGYFAHELIIWYLRFNNGFFSLTVEHGSWRCMRRSCGLWILAWGELSSWKEVFNKRSDCEATSDIAVLKFTMLMPGGGSLSLLALKCVRWWSCGSHLIWYFSDMRRTILVFMGCVHLGFQGIRTQSTKSRPECSSSSPSYVFASVHYIWSYTVLTELSVSTTLIVELLLHRQTGSMN